MSFASNSRAPQDEIILPRLQEGSSPQHLLVTLLGDYWLTRRELLPSTVLVRLMGEFGVSSAGARSALSRLSRRGVLDSSRRGRRSFYGLTLAAAERVLRGSERIMAFGTEEAWDGRWSIVAFSLPEDQRGIRYLLRARLRWLGFAPLYDGMWVSPKADPDSSQQVLAELNITKATVFIATNFANDVGLRSPIVAWNLAELRALYEEFLVDCDQLLEFLRLGDMTPAEALVARTSLMDMYRRFPGLDPDLPSELMPADWPRSVARKMFAEAFDGLAPLAEKRVRQIIAEVDPALAPLAQCYTSTMLLRGEALLATV